MRVPKDVRLIAWKLWIEILPAIEDRLDAVEADQRLGEAGRRAGRVR